MRASDFLSEHIVKRGSKYCLLSKKSNRNLGCYPSRSGAEKRERQVQYFKHLGEEKFSSDQVYYHGTSRDFDKPSTRGAQYLTRMGNRGLGFYLTPDPAVADRYAQSRSASRSKFYGAQKGVGPHIKTYRLKPHNTFDLTQTYTPEQKHELVDQVMNVTGQPMPRDVKKYMFNGNSSGSHVQLLLRYFDKDVNSIFRKLGYDSLTNLTGDQPEIVVLNTDILVPQYAE
jgi:hypothetical protein